MKSVLEAFRQNSKKERGVSMETATPAAVGSPRTQRLTNKSWKGDLFFFSLLFFFFSLVLFFEIAASASLLLPLSRSATNPSLVSVRVEAYSEILDGVKSQKLELGSVAKYIVPMIQDSNPQVGFSHLRFVA